MKNIIVATVAAASLLMVFPEASMARDGGGFVGGGNGGGIGGHRGGYGGSGRYGGGYGGGYGDGFEGALGGLAVGAILGGVLATEAQGGYCARRYRSYDPASGTYLGYDGLRHRC